MAGPAIHQNPYNEVNSTDPNKPDTTGDDLYFNGYSEVTKNHLSQSGDMTESPNSKASRDVYGGPSKGEPNPAGMGGKG